MFGKKKIVVSERDSMPVKAQTMPADFYGGLNPVVKFKKVEKEIVVRKNSELTRSEKKILDKTTAVGSGDPMHVVNIFANKKSSIFFWALLFVFLLAGSGGYYFWQMKQTKVSALPPAPNIQVSSSSVAVSDLPVEPVISTDIVATTSTSTVNNTADIPISFPSTLLAKSADLDADDITDTAEELFNTDPSKPDTDEDGYNDGHELFYLYNPSGKEPMRLIESGLVKEYKNPVFGYALFYPNNWAVGNVDESFREVLFSTLTGENIEVRVIDLLPQESFEDWFGRWAPREKFADVSNFQSRFFQNGKKRTDNLVYYFYDSAHVYVVLYHTTDSLSVNYGSVITMMARSFGMSESNSSDPREFTNL